MKRLLNGFLPAVLLATSVPALANPQLDTMLRSQLDRMFFPEQYMLNIRAVSSTTNSESGSTLPGLAIPENPNAPAVFDPILSAQGANLAQGEYNILLVIDKTVSRERVRIAEEVVRHAMDAYARQGKIQLKVSQRAILKTMPDALKRNIIPQQSALPQQTPEQKEPPKSLFELLMENRDFALRALLVLWSALASLVAVYVLLRSVTSRSGTNVKVENKSDVRPGGEASGHFAQSGNAEKLAGTKHAATRDELYSKDEAAAKLNAEIVREASEFPLKAARILSSWVDSSEENARYAHVFLKNCDVKTVEGICSHMHPVDIESIMNKTIDDFDPFSEENIRVMELMRNEIALLAANQSVKEKPDPLEFTRTMAEDDLVALLRDEDSSTIAIVMTQVRPHRVAKLFSELDDERIAEVMRVLSLTETVIPEQLEEVKTRLLAKASTLSSNFVSEKVRVKTLVQMITAIPLPSKQREFLLHIRNIRNEMFADVRNNILLPNDFEHLPVKTVRVISQSVEPDVLGTALSGLDVEFFALRDAMPEGYRMAFEEVIRREHSTSAIEKAWKKTLLQIQNLVENGIISKTELDVGKAATDATDVNSSEMREPTNAA